LLDVGLGIAAGGAFNAQVVRYPIVAVVEGDGERLADGRVEVPSSRPPGVLAGVLVVSKAVPSATIVTLRPPDGLLERGSVMPVWAISGASTSPHCGGQGERCGD
jgi:hypothetical protein